MSGVSFHNLNDGTPSAQAHNDGVGETQVQVTHYFLLSEFPHSLRTSLKNS